MNGAKMKRIVGTLAISACLLVGRVSHAAPGWVPVPGLAQQIAVGASDLPYVLDINNFVQYLAPAQRVCDPNGLCVLDQRQWVFTNTHATRVSADHYGYLWMIDAAGGVSAGINAITGGIVLVPLDLGLCASSIAPGSPHLQPFPGWNYPFGTPAGAQPISSGQTLTVNYDRSFFTGCGSPSLSGFDTSSFVTSNGGSQPSKGFTTNAPISLDNTETQVAMFTVDGTSAQVPWVIAPLSSGTKTVWAFENGNFVPAPPISVLGLQFDITYVTDHYVVAGDLVWHWNGDAHGNRGNPVWSLVAGSGTPLASSGVKIAQIAYSAALPGTSIGTVGPSNLWMVDTATNIYQYGDVDQGVVK